MINLVTFQLNKNNYNQPLGKNPALAKQNFDSINFAGKSSYKIFSQKFKHAKMTEADFVKKCLEKPEIGSGERGKVYTIPIDGFENYVLKLSQNFRIKNLGKLTEAKNDFPRRNLGQAIAMMGQEALILKKVEGTSLDKLFPTRIESKYSSLEFYKRLSQIPQKAYDRYAQQVRATNQKGYSFDYGNSGNIIIGEKGAIHIIDLEQESQNKLGELIIPFFMDSIGESAKETTQNKKTVLEKLFKAAQKAGFKFEKDDESSQIILWTQEKPISERYNDLINSSAD